MRRPAWAASPNFSECWSASESLSDADMTTTFSGSTVTKSSRRAVLECLQVAKVISLPKDQVEALPGLWGRAGEVDSISTIAAADEANDLSMPFPALFLDLGNAQLTGATDGFIAGCFIGEMPNGQKVMVPFFRVRWSESGRVGGVLMPATSLETRGKGDGFGLKWLDAEVEQEVKAPGKEATKWRAEQMAVESMNTAGAVLRFLESVNVEIVESAMKPQAKAKAIKKGRKVALTVRVKQSSRRVSGESAGHADYSHRFEVRGHYKHFFPEKPNGEPNITFARYAAKHPEKVLAIQGRPCVRFWTPPFVKGPVDKPLVPKIRVVQENNGN